MGRASNSPKKMPPETVLRTISVEMYMGTTLVADNSAGARLRKKSDAAAEAGAVMMMMKGSGRQKGDQSPCHRAATSKPEAALTKTLPLPTKNPGRLAAPIWRSDLNLD